MNKQMNKLKQGFTLIELLVVVVILGILAAIVIPQYGDSTGDAELASLDTTLASTRSALDLYKQHHGSYPSAVTSVGILCLAGATGTGVIDTEGAFLDQLAYYSNKQGETCTVNTDAGFIYGPYISKRVIPANPVTNVVTLTIVTAGDLAMVGDGAAGGWKYDNAAGKFIANDTDNGNDLR